MPEQLDDEEMVEGLRETVGDFFAGLLVGDGEWVRGIVGENKHRL